MGNNFYETLDELFDNFMNTHNLHYNEDVLNIKSQIIQAYDFENLHKGDNNSKYTQTQKLSYY